MILEFDRFTFVICISLFSSYNYFRKMGHCQKLMGHSQKLKIIGLFVIKQDMVILCPACVAAKTVIILIMGVNQNFHVNERVHSIL